MPLRARATTRRAPARGTRRARARVRSAARRRGAHRRARAVRRGDGACARQRLVERGASAAVQRAPGVAESLSRRARRMRPVESDLFIGDSMRDVNLVIARRAATVLALSATL